MCINIHQKLTVAKKKNLEHTHGHIESESIYDKNLIFKI